MSASNRRFSTRKLTVFSSLGLAVLLAACGGPSTPSTPGDTSEPQVRVTSPATADSASYQLAGVVFDNVGVTGVEYALGGGDAQPLTFVDGDFSATINLADGANEITVSAMDEAGNVGTDSITVSFNAPPGAATANVDIAARGDSVTFTGSNFGDSGTVLVGGVEATADSWSETEVTFTVPAGAPSGPQEVTVESSGGSTGFDLFVGVDFESGTLEELAALGLPSGTAVRLGAGTFGQSSAQVLLEGLSLYGQGIGETIVDSGAAPQILSVQVGRGQDVVFDNLELHSDAFLIVSGPAESVGSAALSSLDVTGLVQAAAEQASAAGELHSMALATDTFTMSNVLIEEHVGGGGVLTVDPMAFAIFEGSVVLDNVEFDAANSFLALLAVGDITLTDSTVDNAGTAFASLGGIVSVSGSSVEDSGAGAAFLGVSGILSSVGIEVHDSDFTTYSDSPFYLAPMEVLSGGADPFVSAGSVNLTDSSFRVLAADPAVDLNAGSMFLVGGLGVNTISGNTFVTHRAVIFAEFSGNLDVNGNEFQVGHPAVPNSPIALGHALSMNGFIDFRNNTVEWQTLGGLMIGTLSGISVDGNTFDGGGVALQMSEGSAPAEVNATVSNNVFTGFEAAVNIELDGATGGEGAITVTGNDFDFTMDALGEVAVLTDVEIADVDLNGNRWDGETDVAVINGLILRAGTTAPATGEITEVMP